MPSLSDYEMEPYADGFVVGDTGAQYLCDRVVLGIVGKSRNNKVINTEGQVRDVINHLMTRKYGQKDGPGYLRGPCDNSRRRNDNVSAAYIVPFDYDSGRPKEFLVERLLELGFPGVVSSTYSNGKSETVVLAAKFDEFRRNKYPKLSDRDAAKRYLIEERGMISDIASSTTIQPDPNDPANLLFNHAPLPKMRVVLFLKRPVLFSGDPRMRRREQDLFKKKAVVLGNLIDPSFDHACTDIARLFYSPRTAKGKSFEAIAVLVGEPVDLDKVDVPNVANVRRGSNRAAARLTATSASMSQGPFDALYRESFEIVDLFEDYAPERIRQRRTPGHVAIECPYSHRHSNPDDESDVGCFIRNAQEDELYPEYQFHCCHNGCSGKYRGDFLGEAIRQDWFPEEALYDANYHCEVE